MDEFKANVTWLVNISKTVDQPVNIFIALSFKNKNGASQRNVLLILQIKDDIGELLIEQVRLYYGTKNLNITIMFTVCSRQLELLFKHSFPGSLVFGQYIFQCVFKIRVMAYHMGWISPKIWSDRNFPASYQRLSFFVCRQISKGKE